MFARSMSPLIAAYALLFALVGLVVRHQKRVSRSIDPQKSGRGSSVVLGFAHLTALVSGGLFPFLGLGVLPLPSWFAWSAVVVMGVALGLQVWSMRTLGDFFTATLQASNDQPLVERGPYRLVRHPAYLAQVVFWFSFAAASRDLVTMVLVIPVVAAAYVHRINTEERLLAAAMGERFRDYARARARLVPGVW